MGNRLSRTDLALARQFFSLACKASREHSALAARALKRYGDHGPAISGCVRDHFPVTVKNRLRRLAMNVTRMSDAAYEARPPRVRRMTMLRLSWEVAKAEGSGYYGPRPDKFVSVYVPAYRRRPVPYWERNRNDYVRSNGHARFWFQFVNWHAGQARSPFPGYIQPWVWGPRVTKRLQEKANHGQH